MVLFVVSKHLAAHTFQLVKATHGANNFVAALARLEGTQTYAARLQAYITGYEVAEVARFAEPKKSTNKQPVSAVARMSTLVAEKTKGAQSRWPWTNTDFKLAKLKYRLELRPGAKTQADWLKKPSRGLHPSFQTVIHNDLDDNLIDVVYDPTIPNGITLQEFYGTCSSSEGASPSNEGSSSSSSSSSPSSEGSSPW
ncbi:hypothetical protein PCANC_07394 [Puccinia coronata f. sp. avenae]|uniref:Uncharacterized protein n=1 Tax=Puccinia coronata f. sp. avenae TaxID=200324 RepID=A0A2N5T5A1_9BASI|nr:hypothetical protein PCANC_07394 [Puccinia coronata f. sp. avenae]